MIRRLTKVEYANTLHDFLGVEPKVADELPDEVFGEGYLNTLSPLQSEQYLTIANDALDRVLGPKDGPHTKIQKQLFGKMPGSSKVSGWRRERSPVPWLGRRLVGLPRKRSWMSCCECSISRATTNSLTRMPCA